MTLFELSKDQVRELREDYLTEHFNSLTATVDDVTDEMLIEEYGSTDFSNDDFMAKPRECADNYCTGGSEESGFEEVECCCFCDKENILTGWDIRKDGFKAYCMECGAEMLLCDACMHRFVEFHEEWQPSCSECPFRETGFAKDDVYVWNKK